MNFCFLVLASCSVTDTPLNHEKQPVMRVMKSTLRTDMVGSWMSVLSGQLTLLSYDDKNSATKDNTHLFPEDGSLL